MCVWYSVDGDCVYRGAVLDDSENKEKSDVYGEAGADEAEFTPFCQLNHKNSFTCHGKYTG